LKLQFKYNAALRRDLAPGDRRLWLLRSVALRIQLQANPVWIFEIYYRRLALALAGLLAAFWLLAATALFVWLDRTPHNQVGWFDLAAPWRWSGLRAKRGDTAVLTALDEIKDRDFTTAFYNLRVGVARSPGNVEGRLTLAMLQAGYEPMRAVAVLEEGLPQCGTNLRYLAGLLSLYGRFQIQAHAVEVIEGLLKGGAGPLPPESRLLLQRARVALLLQLGRGPEAEAAFTDIKPATEAETAALRGLQAEVLLRSGHPAEARKIHDAEPPAEAAAAGSLRQAAEIAIALDDADGLQSALRRLKAQAPNDPGVYLFAFQAWHRLKRLSYRDAAEQEYFRAFAGDDTAMQAIAALAVNLDLPEVIARAQRTAVAAHRSPFAYRVHQTELALRRGEFEQATRYLRDWENNIDTLRTPQRFYPEFIKRLTRAAFSGTPDQVSYLLSHLAANRGQMLLPVYGLAVTVLEKAGNPAGAAQLLQAGLRVYPLSQPLLAAQPRVDAAVAATAAKTAAGAPAALATVFVLLPASAEEARTRLEGLLQQDSLAAARDLLRAIRAQKPSWQSAVETDLAVGEVELAFLSLDPLASRTAARAFLDRHHGEPDLLRLVALVSRLAARDRLADARLLGDEIVAAPSATPRVEQALHDLNLADDLAAVAANQTASIAALDRNILAQDWTQAERLLKYLRDKPPAWLSAAPTEVKVREVQVRLGLDQHPLALAALKELVVKPGAPRGAAFRLVRDLLARDERDSAVLLAREIAKLLADDPAAARLLREAEAPRSPE